MRLTVYIAILFSTFSFYVHAIPEVSPDCSRSDLNLWESHVCEIITKNLTQSQCIPARRVPASQNILGLVALFHGYTACPDAFDPLAERLQSAGYLVLSFLTVGHGRKFGDCGENTVCAHGYPVENLPIDRSGYINFITTVNTIVADQVQLLSLVSDQHMIAAVGLSLGGPLATLAVADGNGMYTHMLLFNPFFGISVPPLDRQVANCANKPDECILNFINDTFNSPVSGFENSNDTEIGNKIASGISSLVSFTTENIFGTTELLGAYSQLQSALRLGIVLVTEYQSLLPVSILDILDENMSWGPECENARKERNRGGICSFKIKNLFAVHSFSTYALSRVQDIVNLKKAQFATVERDGITRNGLTYSSLNSASANASIAGLCMYRLVPGCILTGDNECGVPHSMASRAEQLGNAPFYLYWEENYISSTIHWLSNDVVFGEANFKNNRSICVIADNSDPLFFGEIPATLHITVANIFEGSLQKVTNDFILVVLQDLAKRVGFKNSFVFALLRVITDEKKIQFIIQVSKTFISIFESHIKSGNTTSLANAALVSIKVGERHVAIPVTLESSAVRTITTPVITISGILLFLLQFY